MDVSLQRAVAFIGNHAGGTVSNNPSISNLVESAKRCPQFTSLNGCNPESRAIVWQWLEKLVDSRSESADALIKELNSTLLYQTFIAGNYFTVADVVLFYKVEPIMHEITHQDKQTKFINISRWLDYMQKVEGILPENERVTILKNNVYT